MAKSSESHRSACIRLEVKLDGWRKRLEQPNKYFAPVMNCEYGRTFDELERARADWRAAFPIGYVRYYPGSAFHMAKDGHLSEPLAAAVLAADTDRDIVSAINTHAYPL